MAIIILLVFFCFLVIFMKSGVKINKNKSYYNDFEVKGEDVYIYCWISFCNNENKDKSISIEGKFPEDKKSGFLVDESLKGKFVDSDSYDIHIGPKQKLENVKVVFIGKKGDYDKKANKKLPSIIIIENE